MAWFTYSQETPHVSLSITSIIVNNAGLFLFLSAKIVNGMTTLTESLANSKIKCLYANLLFET